MASSPQMKVENTGGTRPMPDASKKQFWLSALVPVLPKREKKTIDAIEKEIADAFPDYQIYRAWTSKMIMAKLLRRDGIKILNVREAMEKMRDDGITDVIVQPTHVINGIENELMTEDALMYQSSFFIHNLRQPVAHNRGGQSSCSTHHRGAFLPTSARTTKLSY